MTTSETTARPKLYPDKYCMRPNTFDGCGFMLKVLSHDNNTNEMRAVCQQVAQMIESESLDIAPVSNCPLSDFAYALIRGQRVAGEVAGRRD